MRCPQFVGFACSATSPCDGTLSAIHHLRPVDSRWGKWIGAITRSTTTPGSLRGGVFLRRSGTGSSEPWVSNRFPGDGASGSWPGRRRADTREGGGAFEMSRKRRDKSMKPSRALADVELDAIEAMLLRARKLRQKGEERRALVTLRHAVNLDETRARSWALLGADVARARARRRRGARLRAGAMAQRASRLRAPRGRLRAPGRTRDAERGLRSRSEPQLGSSGASRRATRDLQFGQKLAS